MGAPSDWSSFSAAWWPHPFRGCGVNLSCLCWGSRGSRRAPVPLRSQQCTWRGAQQTRSHSYPQGALSDSKGMAWPLSPSLSGTPVPLSAPPLPRSAVAVARVRCRCGKKQPLPSRLSPPVPCRWRGRPFSAPLSAPARNTPSSGVSACVSPVQQSVPCSPVPVVRAA